MKKVIKTAALVLAFVMICCVSYGTLRVSAAEDLNDMGTRAISDINKIWTLKFRTPVDVNSLNNTVSVQDLTDGSTVNVNVSAGDDEKLAKVNPPFGGYKLSHNYKLTIDKSTKSKKKESLPKSVVLNFTLTSKNNNSYNTSANVVVSPFIPTLKKITISTTNLPSASQYKVEDNKLSSIGSMTGILTSESTVKVSLYDNRGNLLGTSILDVSSTKSTSTNITLAD